MRKVRSRLTILLLILVAVSSGASVLLAVLAINGRFLNRDTMRYVLFGYAIKDVLLLLVAVTVIVVIILLMSRSTTSPILELNRAIKEVADGNYDVQVNMKDRVEEFGELQKNFNTMVAQLKNNEYLRKDFISNVSHELKTPLTIMSGYADLLAEGGLTEDEQREYARLISAEAQRLITLSSNMLRLSSMEHSAIQCEKSAFRLDEQIRQAVLSLEPRWSAKGQDVTLELQDVPFTGDEDLLNQVWLNLIGNAVKFTPDGGRIRVTLVRNGDYITARVRDSGIGMDRATMNRMFEQFYRGDTEKRYEGSGLGLPLARRIVLLHGGEITAVSAPGKGSEFTVVLPVRR